MTRIEILEKLAVYIADFILTDHPLHMLVGDDGMPGNEQNPDEEALIELQSLLCRSGIDLCERAGQKIAVQRLLLTARNRQIKS